ncbi:Trace amine-associated receptor 1 [Trichoplax sp. H2]|nr:Trace amine-associated receptor 1 [Trichoplax sp. H2]|eukprot:RDD38812.1 Trace amine-associated receptor 1 [Trichoplax sp. H2]
MANNTDGLNCSLTESCKFTYTEGIWLFIGVFTVITNSALLLSLRTSNIRRSPSNMLIESTFVIGILFGGMYIIPRWTAIKYIYKFGYFCSMLPPLGASLFLNYNLHQCLICLYRWFAIKNSLQLYKSIKRKLSIFLSASWILSFIMGYMPLMTYRKIRHDRCVTSSDNLPAKKIYHCWQFFALFILPATVIVICYSKILHVFYTQRRKVFTTRIISGISDVIKRIPNSRTVKASLQIGLLAIIFVVMIAPYVCVYTLSILGFIKPEPNDIIYSLHKALQYLAFLYPAVNPLLYAYFIDSIRYNFFKNISCRCKRSKPKQVLNLIKVS